MEGEEGGEGREAGENGGWEGGEPVLDGVPEVGVAVRL